MTRVEFRVEFTQGLRSGQAIAFCAVLTIGVFGCGGAATPVIVGGSDDMAMAMGPVPDLTQLPDLTPLKDLVGLIPEPCGAGTCAVGQKCCFTGNAGSCMDSCPDGAFSFACYGPQDCAGNPCCVKITKSKPTGLACSKSVTDCNPAIDFFSSQSGQTRFCNVDADCTRGANGTKLNKCCSGTFMGQPGKICFDPNFAGAANLNCP